MGHIIKYDVFRSPRYGRCRSKATLAIRKLDRKDFSCQELDDIGGSHSKIAEQGHSIFDLGDCLPVISVGFKRVNKHRHSRLLYHESLGKECFPGLESTGYGGLIRNVDMISRPDTSRWREPCI